MKVQRNDEYTLVSVNQLSFDKLVGQIDEFIDNHLVLEILEDLNINEDKISLFLNISSDFRSNGMSFVILKAGIDIDDFPESINIVPTLQEAKDIMEMEAIERDLGF